MNEEVGQTELDPVSYNDTKPTEWQPTPLDLLRENEIRIRFLSGRGCIIKVGCKEIAFEDNQKAIEALNDYVADPITESKKWKQIFK
jgi:hypothetical protein